MQKIMEVYLIDTQHGENWYIEANAIAREMADMSGLELIQTAGIISALSCNSSWMRNLQAAWEFCRTGNTGHLQIALDKAQRVTKAKGKFEILDVLGSPKLQNFFLNIAYPDLDGPVTIDRHAFNAARFGAKRVVDKTKVTPKRYEQTANEYRKLAYELGLKPHVLQAIVWSNYINLYAMYTYKIIQDTEPVNPREWDNLGTMFCQHRQYNLGDKNAAPPNWKDDIMLPLYLYDHSGITIQTTPFSCPWDSGQVGVIYISREKVRAEYGVKRISQKLEARILEYLKNEVAVYDQYLTGDVWGYIIKKDGEEIEACWGFFGRDECENEAKSIIENLKIAEQ